MLEVKPSGPRGRTKVAKIGGTYRVAGIGAIRCWGPIYKISYDLSYDYRKFIVRSTYDSDLKPAEISVRNIVS